MAKFKVRATYNIDVEVEVDAETEDEAISNFIAMDVRDVIADSLIAREDVEDIDAELTEGTFEVETTAIDYDVDYNTCWDIVAEENPDIDEDSEEFDQLVYAKIDEIKEKLPQVLHLEVTCEKADLDEYVADAVSEETNWLVDAVDYKINKVL